MRRTRGGVALRVPPSRHHGHLRQRRGEGEGPRVPLGVLPGGGISFLSGRLRVGGLLVLCALGAMLYRFLTAQGIETAGRYGAWEYSSMEDGILAGRAAAARVRARRAA